MDRRIEAQYYTLRDFIQNIDDFEDGKLLVNGELLAEDSVPLKGKDYWGAGHERLIRDYYDQKKYFTVFDIQNTMDATFAVYESASKGGEEIELFS